ncbi:superoxide dismutase, partial [Candidatus Uhrbacteria bacterium CG_4_9_14_3_um_filter_36_7]
MIYTAKNYEHLLGIPGFSHELLTNHFRLYEGYVKNVNIFFENLSQIEKTSLSYSELKRRFGWEFDGMRLHALNYETQ